MITEGFCGRTYKGNIKGLESSVFNCNEYTACMVNRLASEKCPMGLHRLLILCLTMNTRYLGYKSSLCSQKTYPKLLQKVTCH